jgi:predicted aspartyl protease
LSYQECAQKLFAANESVVPIAGSTELQYKIGGNNMKYEVLVSEAIDEIIFGADWLSNLHCIWDFARGTLFIRDGERTATTRVVAYRESPTVPTSHFRQRDD